MRNNFRTYNLSVEFYRQAYALRLSSHLKEQLSRAASSIVLNLAEGAGRGTRADQGRFFQIAFGSLRECQAILDLAQDSEGQAVRLADRLAAHLYCLIKRCRAG